MCLVCQSFRALGLRSPWVQVASYCSQTAHTDYLILPRYSPNIAIHLLGLSTHTVGISFREIYCDMHHLQRFACSNQWFACPKRSFILAQKHKALFFLCEIPRLKLIVLRSIRSFEVKQHTRAVLGKNGDVSNHCSLCAILDSNVSLQ
jgi:hypothetical protein